MPQQATVFDDIADEPKLKAGSVFDDLPDEPKRIDYSYPPEPSNLQKLGAMAKDFTAGVGSGVISTGTHLAEGARRAINVIGFTPSAGAGAEELGLPQKPAVLPPIHPSVRAAGIPPASTAGALGKGAEQFGEYLLPGGIVRRGAKALQVGGRVGPVVNAITHAGLQAGADTAMTAAQTGGDPDAMKTAAETSGIVNAGIGVPMAVARSIPAVQRALQAGGERLYGSAIKVPPAVDRGKRTTLIQSGLENRIPVSRGGLEQTRGLVEGLDKQVADAVADASGRGATVPAQLVANRVDDVRPRFNTVNPVSDQETLSAAQHEFLAQHPPQIPIDEAQDIKRNTYRKLRESAYGEQSTAQKEGQKALARGLKEEIYNQLPPEIRALGPKEKVLIDLENVLERFANREGNKQVIPLPTAASHGVTMMALTKFVDGSPWIKSKLGIAIAKGTQGGTGTNLVKRLSVPAALAMYGNNQQQ